MVGSDEELWARARHEEAAFVALYRRHARPLLGFCVRRTEDPEAGAEVCAEVFAAAIVAMRSRGAAPASVSGWLYGTARNKLADAARRGQVDARARQRLALQPVVLTDEALEQVVEAAGDVRVQAALDGLPDTQRDAVERRVLRDEPYDRIAAAQGTSPANARQRVARGLARLRDSLQEDR